MPTLVEHAAATPDKLAVVEGVSGERTRTYAELSSRVNRLARAYRTLGATPGSRVAVMLANSLEFVEAGCATGVAQTWYVPVNWHLKTDELAYILADSNVRVLVTSPELESIAHAATAAVGCPLLVTGSSYEQAIAAEDDAPLDGAWSGPAWVLYTSGTTGRPKGVVHGEPDAAAMEQARAALIAMWGLTPDDIYGLAGPGYHAGPGGYCFTTTGLGGTVVALPKWDAREFLAAIDRHGITTVFLTPAHLIRILEVPEEVRATYDVSSLRLLIQSGAPCPVDVKRRILDVFPTTEISEMYGASEGGVTRITTAEWRERPGSVGKPWPGVEVRILDASGAELPVGTEGLIYSKPPSGRRFHYHGDDAKTDAAWLDDAFTVGDIGRVDEDGYLYVTDRVSDMVLWGGVNIYPREIEDVLFTHPTVVDCAVFGVPDDRYGEVLKAVIEVRGATSPESLQEYVRERLADYKVPTYVVIVDTLPRDPNGKVLKRLLREDHVKAAAHG
ncbi:MAG: long-chain acyl-CoA synthetase [Frankiales bacterium]|nr:long-chain acyl-CoA synthetase [Frankiales bacterium]